MEIIKKDNSSITKEDFNELYKMYYDNLSSKDLKFSTLIQEQWISEINRFPEINYLMFYENNSLIGYIIIYLKDEENFIREFEIKKDHQNDGKTFIDMIKMALPYTDKSKKYAGIILPHNQEAKMAFKRAGALINEGRFECDYDRLVKATNADSKTLWSKHPPKKKKGFIKIPKL